MWNPPIALSTAEQKIAARTQKARKFFVFLRTIRHELLDAVRSAGTILIEDDAYFDLRYEGTSLPAIYSLDDSGSVVYMGTLSKTMGPGMRLGWLVGPPDLIRPMAAVKVDGGQKVCGAHVPGIRVLARPRNSGPPPPVTPPARGGAPHP